MNDAQIVDYKLSRKLDGKKQSLRYWNISIDHLVKDLKIEGSLQ